MPRLEWALACQRVLTDRDTNSISYIEAVEELTLPNIPYLFPPVFISTLWRRDTSHEPIRFRITVVSPSGESLADFSPDVREENPALRHRVNVLFGGFSVRETGGHKVLIEQNVAEAWQTAGEFIIDIRLAGGGELGA